MKHKGTVVSRDELLKKIWGYDFSGESRTVDVHIRTLRSKLGDCGEVIKMLRQWSKQLLGPNKYEKLEYDELKIPDLELYKDSDELDKQYRKIVLDAIDKANAITKK